MLSIWDSWLRMKVGGYIYIYKVHGMGGWVGFYEGFVGWGSLE